MVLWAAPVRRRRFWEVFESYIRNSVFLSVLVLEIVYESMLLPFQTCIEAAAARMIKLLLVIGLSVTRQTYRKLISELQTHLFILH